MSRLSRKEMKRDEVRKVLSRTLLFLSENLKRIALGAVAVVILVVLGTLVADRIGGRQDEASDALAEAMEIQNAPIRSELSDAVAPVGPVFETDTDRRAEAKRRFEQVVTDYPRSSSARIAKSYVAKIELDAGRPEAAREIWSELASSGDDALAVQITLNLVALDRELGRGAEAESRLLDLVDSPTSALPQSWVLQELAVTQESLGKVEESRSTYQRIVDEHPNSPYARSAAEKVSASDGSA